MHENVHERKEEKELGTTFEELLDRYMMLPFEERDFVEKVMSNAIYLAERKTVKREMTEAGHA